MGGLTGASLLYLTAFVFVLFLLKSFRLEICHCMYHELLLYTLQLLSWRTCSWTCAQCSTTR